MVPDEDQLIAQARGGETGAFNQLVERYQALVYNVCRRMLSDPDQADDATQEAFFAAFRSMRTFRGGSFRGWLLRIAGNECYNLLRTRQRHSAGGDLQEAAELADPEPQPVDLALSRETIATLEAAISQLPAEQRLCVVLVDVHGLDYAEAAEAMGAELGTVKSRLSRGRAQLRELLSGEFRPKVGG